MATLVRNDDERNSRAAVRAKLDPFRPQGFFVEAEPQASGEVISVATLFLTNRECPWRCVYCDLWKSTTLESVPRGAIPRQIDYALNALRGEPCRAIKLYNAGSFFDPKAIPPEDFSAIAERVAHFENVIVECHPALVNDSAVRFGDLLRHGTATLEVAMGLEAADDSLLERLNKRMTLALFRQACELLKGHGIGIRAFIIVKPPYVRSEREALELAQRSMDFAFNCGAAVVSLIPARFGPVELNDLARTGEFSPPAMETVEACGDYGVKLRRGRVFTDLWDIESLGGCCACMAERVARLREMNLRQTVLPRVACQHDATACRAMP